MQCPRPYTCTSAARCCAQARHRGRACRRARCAIRTLLRRAIPWLRSSSTARQPVTSLGARFAKKTSTANTRWSSTSLPRATSSCQTCARRVTRRSPTPRHFSSIWSPRGTVKGRKERRQSLATTYGPTTTHGFWTLPFRTPVASGCVEQTSPARSLLVFSRAATATRAGFPHTLRSRTPNSARHASARHTRVRCGRTTEKQRATPTVTTNARDRRSRI